MSRVRPVTGDEITDDVRTAMKGWMRPDATELAPPLDTLARHPELARAYLGFSRHLLFTSSLSPRARELVILRTAAVTGSAFERAQHEEIARREGIDDADIARVAEGADAPGWSPADAALLRGTDELLSTWAVSDATWDQLASDLDEHQLMDLVFTVGNYALLAMALRTFGVEPATDAPQPAAQWDRGGSGG
jgi:AhpD family alkylhydroperoxidase